MRHTLTFITILLILASCQTNDFSRSETFQILLPDTFKTHRPNFDNLMAYGRQMHLPRIDTGSKNFELRIWTNSMTDPDQMVLVRKFDTTVLGQKFDYNSSFDSLEYYKLSDTYQNIALTQFVDSVQKIDFTKMLSQNEIENFEDNIADGITYHMEISTPNYYKLISYHCPERFAKTDLHNKRFLDLILAVDSHVRFYSPICSL